MANPVQNTEIGLAALFVCATILFLMLWGDPDLLTALISHIAKCG